MAHVNSRFLPAARTKVTRKHTDENVLPLGRTKSGLNTKSTGLAQKCTSGVVGIRGPPQRTALGDVSNKVPSNRLNGKENVVEKPKASRVLLPRKQTSTTTKVQDKPATKSVNPVGSNVNSQKPVLTTIKNLISKDSASDCVSIKDAMEIDIERSYPPVKTSEVYIKQKVCDESDTDLSDGIEDELDFDEDQSMVKGAGNVVFEPEDRDLEEIRLVREAFEDEIDYWDTTMVAEYSDDIFDYMCTLERKLMPNPNYMDHQTEIEWSMRGILIDWLVQVHGRFHLLQETLFLCVNFIDRFLTAKVVSLPKLQLVGATALFIAAKYEEIQCPSVHEIVYMVDNGYSAEEVLKAERYMINMLNFELGWPGPLSFLRRISKADDYDVNIRTLAKYLMEVTLMDQRFLGASASLVAAGSHWLAKKMLARGDWETAHVFYSNYTERQIIPFAVLLMDCLEQPKDHHPAIYTKFCDKAYKKAAKFVELWVKKGCKIDVIIDAEDGDRHNGQSESDKENLQEGVEMKS